MKKLLPLLLLFTGMVNAQVVAIPDNNFKAKLIAADTNNAIALDSTGNPIKIDTNNDGQIQQTEALTVFRLNLWDGYIVNLSGISSFTNLTRLDCHNNLITTLDLSTLTNLTQVICNQNNISTLNVSGLNNLILLSCGENQLASINLAGLPNLALLSCDNNNLSSINLDGLNNLVQLACSYNQITNLSVTGLNHLAFLQCDHNLLTNLNLSGMNNLVQLYCFYNQISNLNLNSLTALTTLSCGENNITTLNLNGLTSLNLLECSYLPDNLQINALNTNALTFFQFTGNGSTLTLNGFPNIDSMMLNFSSNGGVTLNTAGFNSNADIYIQNAFGGFVTLNGNAQTTLHSFNCDNSRATALNINSVSGIGALNCRNNALTSLTLNDLGNLTSLDCSSNRITSLTLSDIPNLTYLNCASNIITNLDLSLLPHLKHLDCSNDGIFNVVGNQITSLNLSAVPDLEYLDCSNYHMVGTVGAFGNEITSLNVNSLTHLKEVKCSANKIPTLTVNGLTDLQVLDCSNNLLTSLDVIGLTDLTSLNYSHNLGLSNLNMAGLVNITELDCSGNSVATLSLSEMTNLTKLNCSSNYLTTLDLSGLTNITNLYCDNNSLTTLDISMMPGLTSLGCSNNSLTHLNVGDAPNLQYLQCGSNYLTDLNLAGLTMLTNLYCNSNLLTNLNLSSQTNLTALQCGFNSLTQLDISTIPNLLELDCNHNLLTSLDLTQSPNLTTLICSSNALTSLDFSQTPNLYGIYFGSNALTTVDVSNVNHLGCLWGGDNQLTEVFIKNGSNEISLDFNNNPDLAYICADTAQLQTVQNMLNDMGMTATVCNSYCTFTPGGPHNTVIATTIFDGNNNGCNLNDPLHPNIRVDFEGGSTGSAFTNTNGVCTFYADAGFYTLYPNIENASAFNVSPANAEITFPDNNNNIMNQSFCLSANGIHPDVEVVISPIGPARPGFDAHYKIVYKNKGNQVLSGNIAFTFDDAKLDLVTAVPVASSQGTNSMDWAYSGLLPFEARTIDLVFTVNSPLSNPAVNNGDLLNFTAAITPSAGDESPSDNAFTFNQIVVGPFDPNNITCIEGSSVSPVEIGNYLHYIVNFENTGNFQAENVVVRSVIDLSKYDLTTLQVLNTSHNVYTRITGNVVEFIFQGINLDAAHGTPPVGGHGDVLFKIKTRNTLQPNDMVFQRAGIYFDYNAPIDTTDAETTFAALNNPIPEFDNSVTVYPNPTTSVINIDSKFSIDSIELYDVQGRILETHLENDSTSTLDISNKTKGIYFLKIKTEKGSKVEKIVKE